MPRKPGRPQSDTPLLSREQILQAALQIVDADGVEALSMRRLASALGVDPMAIYHYLPNKSAIIDGLIELVFKDFQLPQLDDASWEDRVRAFALGYYETVKSHKHLVVHIVADVSLVAKASNNASDEEIYAALLSAGFNGEQVFFITSMIIDHLHGYLLGEPGMQGGEALIHDMITLEDQKPYTKIVMNAIQDKRLNEIYGVEQVIDFILAAAKALLLS